MSFLLRQFSRFAMMLFGVSILAFGFTEFAYIRHSSFAQTSTLWQHILNYFHFLSELFHGNFGITQHNAAPVLSTFIHKLPASIELIIPAIIIAWLVGVPLATWAEKKPGGYIDRAVQTISVAFYSLPVFWLGLILMMVFATGFELFPVGGRIDYIYDITPVTGFALIDTLLSDKPYAFEAFIDVIHHLILPIITLSLLPLSYVILQLKAGMETIHHSEFIMAARSRGMSNTRLLWVHSLPNAIQPVIASMSLQFSVLITSTIIVEYLFSWPGIGHWFLILVQQQDFIALRGALMLIATVILIANIATDLLRYLTNPKLRRE
ncbi:MAG TPA: ABC transporter permease subunit [Aeromonadales bacterium]|nr:ABC transporter permease subunit [Aeromonadales bacterium]